MAIGNLYQHFYFMKGENHEKNSDHDDNGYLLHYRNRM